MKGERAFSRTAGGLLFAGVVLALLLGACATGPASGTEGTWTPAGTWRGGSCYEPGGDSYNDLGVRYLMIVVPIGHDRYAVVTEGSYVTPPGFARMTQYSGELVRKKGGEYECIAMAYFNTSTAFPPDSLPQVWVVHGTIEMVDRDTLSCTWDTFDIYDWHSQPFVDPPLGQPAATPIVETYKRFTFVSAE